MTRLILILMLCLTLSAVEVFGCNGLGPTCVNAEETAEVPDWVFGDMRLTASQKKQAVKEARIQVRNLKADLSDGSYLSAAKLGDRAIGYMVKRATKALEDAGDKDAAYFYAFQFRTQYEGYLTRMVASRDIGDHPTMILSQWIEDFYNHAEFILGVTACKMLHLSDLMTINRTTKIVFSACAFPMDAVTGQRIDEYRNHFNQGMVYYGFVPVVTYWVIDVPLMFTPVGMLAGAIASAGEYLMATFVGPKLSDTVFNNACAKGEH